MKYRLGDVLYIKGRIGWKGLKKKEYLDKRNLEKDFFFYFKFLQKITKFIDTK